MNNLKCEDDGIMALQAMVEGEPVVRIGIENYHFEEVITEEKSKEVKTVPKSEL
jgi:hypothetical protein